MSPRTAPTRKSLLLWVTGYFVILQVRVTVIALWSRGPPPFPDDPMHPTSANIQPAQLSHYSCIFPSLLYKITPQSLTVFPVCVWVMATITSLPSHGPHASRDLLQVSGAAFQLPALIRSMSAADGPSLHIPSPRPYSPPHPHATRLGLGCIRTGQQVR